MDCVFYIPCVHENRVHKKIELLRLSMHKIADWKNCNSYRNLWSNSLVSCHANKVQNYVQDPEYNIWSKL